MGDLRGFVKIQPHAMTHEFTHDRTALTLGIGLDGVSDIAHGVARSDGGHAVG